ncbi:MULTISPECIES: flavodoxin [unclassified Agarivorans]|uniref:flavodoxin n=1 Tax=unclassified Agarivorans TaxID=2636026 RepID=UPI0010DAB4DF|nr:MULTISPECIES: flavodoxin [unclassified Agarivorans]MDO6685947.1 flavodoxin [Agarivorans sp. 3_MG-2023]MDO6713915.1 flavodoxin [Agarivorans sp. 2_MG-2023]MDO6762247.1 flavodoxin [Agarivorans sp. 1_MG-2023]GDY26082.1 flavodoxin [Agarivorans sp. Toyoura001]
MAEIGIFFGTDTGTTRKIAKQIHQQLGAELSDKPLNINRVDIDTLSSYKMLILGTPTLGEGQLPGLAADCQTESWDEFMPQLDVADFAGIKVALYGLGDQVNYAGEFVDGLGELYDAILETGADVVGEWPAEGYEFDDSSALLENGKFAGLVLDNDNQSELHPERISGWLEQIKAEFGV